MQPADDDFLARTTARVTATADRMTENLDALTVALHRVMTEEILELRGDQQIVELLRLSVGSNLATIADVVRADLPAGDVVTPAAAVDYARRLAQRGISSSALLRAYRLGQANALAWSLDRIAEEEPDPQVAYAAGQAFTAITFRYIDAVSEQVLVVYEAERERWLANRNTIRATVIAELVDGTPPETHAAEQALGYRLDQHHLGVVVWQADEADHADHAGDLGGLEQVVHRLGRHLGSNGTPLFAAQDRATAWGWIPLGQPGAAPDLTGLETHDARIAVGIPARGVDGFRQTHRDALGAQAVAAAAGEHARPITSYGDSEVRIAALLVDDLDATRRLVRTSLGDLAADNDAAARLRETLRIFLRTRNSYAATAELVHLHKNTVKYRVDRAVQLRGRGLDEDRLDLELALAAAHWLGTAVLDPRASGLAAPATLAP